MTHLPNRDIFQNEEAVEMAVHGYPLTQEPVHSRDGILKNPYQKKKNRTSVAIFSDIIFRNLIIRHMQ